VTSTSHPRSNGPSVRQAPGVWRGFAGAAGICLGAAGVAWLLASVLDNASLVLVFLLAVVLSASVFGRAPALLAAGLSVLLFNFAIVPPRFSLTVSDERFLFTFAVMLIVGLIVGQLTAGLKAQASAARDSEQRVFNLYGISRDLGRALIVEQVAEIVDAFVARQLGRGVVMWVRGRSGSLQAVLGAPNESLTGLASQYVAASGGAVPPADRRGSAGAAVLPLRGTMAVRGALAVVGAEGAALSAEDRQMLETCSALVGSALERIHYIEVARDSAVEVEGERLRNSLLSAISHDLRTPLASMVGLSESLQLTGPRLSAEQSHMATAMAATARRMSALVNNLLEMARLESGAVRLDLQWQPVEEVVGSALAAVEPVMANHLIDVVVPEDMALVRFDAVLMERVLVNLLENAARYTPAGSCVRLAARVVDDSFELVVSDNGPGLPRGREAEMFHMFERGQRESTTPGVGLGLALCHAIVEAHGGTITAAKSPEGGARFAIRLPQGQPPVPPAADALAQGSEP
jgi:two-component system sensor histidine kinase KdpD